MLHALIMAGGGGTRFWPRSRQKKPKQFLTLAGERTLLEQAVDRLEAQVPAANLWIATAATHKEDVVRLLPALTAAQIVGEPCGRDTAACIALGSALIARRDPSATMIVTPADHVIEPAQEFRRAVQAAAQFADEHPETLITFGITPTHPATGYGYIHRGPAVAERLGVRAFRVQAFREKPSVALAEQLLATGEYYWNAGIFVWKAAAILKALQENQPQLYGAVQAIADAWETPRRAEVFEREYTALGKISIDYAVMERAKNVLVVEAPYRWDDVGSWLALERLHPQDADGNTVLATHAGLRTHNCVIAGEPGLLVATVGVSDLIIIQDGDAILIADRRDESGIKQLVEQLKQRGLEKYL